MKNYKYLDEIEGNEILKKELSDGSLEMIDKIVQAWQENKIELKFPEASEDVEWDYEDIYAHRDEFEVIVNDEDYAMSKDEMELYVLEWCEYFENAEWLADMFYDIDKNFKEEKENSDDYELPFA